jgi:hypothetical protein
MLKGSLKHVLLRLGQHFLFRSDGIKIHLLLRRELQVFFNCEFIVGSSEFKDIVKVMIK